MENTTLEDGIRKEIKLYIQSKKIKASGPRRGLITIEDFESSPSTYIKGNYNHWSTEFINHYSNKLNWTLISTNRIFRDGEIELWKDKLSWPGVILNTQLDEEFIINNKKLFRIIDLIELQKKLSTEFYINVIKNEKEYQLYDNNHIKKYSLNIYVNSFIEHNKKVTLEFLKEFKKEIDWNSFNILNLSLNHLFKYQNNISKNTWSIISKEKNISEKWITKLKRKIDWNEIGRTTKYNCLFVDKNFKKMNNEIISECQELTETFIRKHANKLNWYLLLQNKYTILSDKLLLDFYHKIPWDIFTQKTRLTFSDIKNRYLSSQDTNKTHFYNGNSKIDLI